MFKFNNITRILCMAVDTSVTPSTDNVAFNPTEHVQGVGVLDSMKETAMAQQAAEEETGSVSLEEPVVTDNALDPQVVVDPVIVPEIASEESSDPKATDSQDNGGGYTYKGTPVEVTNTPEMTEAFKEKSLDIDAVNAELYSEGGLTDATRASLDEAFGKLSVDMYLQGMNATNEAMHQTHINNVAANDKAMDDMTTEVTGGKMTEVMAWANTNLSPEDYAKYADVINGDDIFQVKLALSDLTSRSGLGPTALTVPTVKARPEDSLLDGNNIESAGAEGITAAEYREAFTNGEYRKNPNDWDRRRAIGMDARI